jgi:hypothetical protein
MTEDEAKTRWCPFARTLDWTVACGGDEPELLAAAVNRGPHGPQPEALCIGSACMAWRWALEYYRDPGATDPTKYRPSAADGYCGLAGVPTC